MIEVTDLALVGLKLIRPKIFYDDRGFFSETYRKSFYREKGIEVEFVQDNHSFSKKGVIRGMHFQRSPGQAKLVQVLEGKIFDVAVDMRHNSPTFGKWEGIYLTEETQEQLFIPVGFAHGFCVVSEHARVIYKVSHPYIPEEEKTFCYNDPEIGIIWPIESPLVSQRDREAPPFKEIVK